MDNLERFFKGLPLKEAELEMCGIALEELKQMDRPLSLFIKYPNSKQWVYKDALQWLEYHLALKMGNQYGETGDLAAFTAQTAKKICEE